MAASATVDQHFSDQFWKSHSMDTINQFLNGCHPMNVPMTPIPIDHKNNEQNQHMNIISSSSSSSANHLPLTATNSIGSAISPSLSFSSLMPPLPNHHNAVSVPSIVQSSSMNPPQHSQSQQGQDINTSNPVQIQSQSQQQQQTQQPQQQTQTSSVMSMIPSNVFNNFHQHPTVQASSFNNQSPNQQSQQSQQQNNNNQQTQQNNNQNQQQLVTMNQGQSKEIVKVEKEPAYVDVTPFLVLPQHEASRRLGVPCSTLSKRWKEASVNRKWPYRIVCKLDKEITTLLKNVENSANNLSTPLSPAVEENLGLLLKRRQDELRTVVIRIN